MAVSKVSSLFLKFFKTVHTCTLCRHNSAAAVASVATQRRVYHEGEQLHGYRVNRVVPVPELSLTAVLLDHTKTGAQHLHVDRDDSDNVFGVALRTTPRDSTGVPHILEHLSLCGSDRFPVRDPFFKMLTRSLSTFMNAFTASDWTMYPFSTQNRQDYENLMSVYLDAVFFPRLRELDFRQEGWRLEHIDLKNPKSPLVFKGVVFNEMKGVFSNPQQLFSERCQNLLLPSHTYSVVSGGDPLCIPDLTWQHLKHFHAKHYHPSNARFYTYGNQPLERHLELINKTVLSKFDKTELDTSVPLETRWTSPQDVVITCSPDPMSPDPNKQTTIAVSYLLHDVTDTFEACTLSILGSLLVDGEKSPFYQSLIDSNIGSDYAPVVGYSGNTRDSSFSIGLQRIDKNDVTKVKDIIDATFQQVIQNGFEPERIEAILHKIELSQKHQADKFGLHLGINIIPSWTHGGDPTLLLQVNQQVDWFKQQLRDNPRYLQETVNKYFQKNTHKLTLVMTPEETYDAKYQRSEQSKLDEAIGRLSDSDKENIYTQGLELAELQMRQEDLSCLPTLRVDDIERQTTSVTTTTVLAGNVPVQLCVQPTNGVTYFRAVSSLAGLPVQLRPYVPLFCEVVTRMGAGDMDYKDLSEQIELKTGGLHTTPHLVEHRDYSEQYEQSLLFSSHCLDRNTTAMFHIWTEIFNRLSLADPSRLHTLIHMSASELSSSLSDSGHRYAMTHAASKLQPCANMKELMTGITQVNLMKSLAERSQFDEVIDILTDIARHVLNADNMRCAINATPGYIDEARKNAEKFVSCLRHHSKPGVKPNSQEGFYTKDVQFSATPGQTHFELPFQVNFVSKSVRAVPYTHPHFASLRILARLLTTRYLHREIREKGGAYGGGAVGDSSGLFHFYSYRDPNLSKTLDAFSGATAWAANGGFTQQDIDEAKLSVFSQVDSPIPPGSKGMRLFLHNIDDVTFQQHRQRLLDVTKEDLIAASQRYLANSSNPCSVSVLGPTNELTAQAANWNVSK